MKMIQEIFFHPTARTDFFTALVVISLCCGIFADLGDPFPETGMDKNGAFVAFKTPNSAFPDSFSVDEVTARDEFHCALECAVMDGCRAFSTAAGNGSREEVEEQPCFLTKDIVLLDEMLKNDEELAVFRRTPKWNLRNYTRLESNVLAFDIKDQLKVDDWLVAKIFINENETEETWLHFTIVSSSSNLSIQITNTKPSLEILLYPAGGGEPSSNSISLGSEFEPSFVFCLHFQADSIDVTVGNDAVVDTVSNSMDPATIEWLHVTFGTMSEDVVEDVIIP